MAQQTTSEPRKRSTAGLGLGAPKRRTVATVIVAALLGAGVWLLIGQAASYSQLIGAIRRAGVGWLALAVAGALVGYLGYTLLYQALARVERGPRPDLPTALRVTVAVFGVSIVATSAGRLGGEYWSLRRMREEPSRAWARVLAINTAQWGVLASLAWVGSLVLLPDGGPHAPLSVELAWLLVLPACVVPALYLSSPKRPRFAEDRGGRVRRTFAAGVGSVVLLRRAASRRDLALRAVGGGLIHWGGDLLTVWAALHAFGVGLGWAPLVVAFATGYASTVLPLPAGGAGGVDAASTYALTLVGVPLGPALLATLVQRLCTYWLPLFVALASARSLKRLGADLAGVPRPQLARGRRHRRAVALAGGPS